MVSRCLPDVVHCVLQLEGQLSIETVLSGVIQDAKKIRQALKEAGEDTN
jgi:hypothetical protein